MASPQTSNVLLIQLILQTTSKLYFTNKKNLKEVDDKEKKAG